MPMQGIRSKTPGPGSYNLSTNFGIKNRLRKSHKDMAV